MNAAPYRLIVVLLALAATAPAARAQGAPAAKPAAKPAAMPAAQDTSVAGMIAMLRSDVRAEKTQIITQALPLTEAQAKAFWPLYRQYDSAAMKLGDQRVALIMEFAQHYDSMTDAKALDLAGRALALDAQRIKLRQDQVPILAKVLPGKLVARFLQVDTYISRAIDLKLGLELPMVK